MQASGVGRVAPQSKGWPLSSKSSAQTRCVGSWLHLKSSQVERSHKKLLLVAGTFPGANGHISPGQADEQQNGFPQLPGRLRPESRASSGKRVRNNEPKMLRKPSTPQKELFDGSSNALWPTFSQPEAGPWPCGKAHVVEGVVEGYALSGIAIRLSAVSAITMKSSRCTACRQSVSRMIASSPFSSPDRRWRCSAF